MHLLDFKFESLPSSRWWRHTHTQSMDEPTSHCTLSSDPNTPWPSTIPMGHRHTHTHNGHTECTLYTVEFQCVTKWTWNKWKAFMSGTDKLRLYQLQSTNEGTQHTFEGLSIQTAVIWHNKHTTQRKATEISANPFQIGYPIHEATRRTPDTLHDIHQTVTGLANTAMATIKIQGKSAWTKKVDEETN